MRGLRLRALRTSTSLMWRRSQDTLRMCSSSQQRKPAKRRAANDDDMDAHVDDLLLQDDKLFNLSRAAVVEPVVMRRMSDAEERRLEHTDNTADDDGGGEEPPKEAEPAGCDEELNTTAAAETSGGALSSYLAEYKDYLNLSYNRCVDMPIREVVDRCLLYLRATENPATVSAREEACLFPVLVQRLDELSVGSLLDIVECHWARSTLVRHGTFFKDLARDAVAAKAATLTPEEILRTIIVMGMSAGRRKRDLEFFQVMGRLLIIHINAFKDPNELVRIMTAFARAKIVPPPAFLAMIGRRLPVLCKAKSLAPLPCYRALINLFKMGHDQMNAFRFLADRIYDAIDENIKLEKKRKRLEELQAQQPQQSPASSDEPHSAATKQTTTDEHSSTLTATTPTPVVTPLMTDLLSEMTITTVVQRRFLLITGLKPVHVTKLLLILAKFGAPYQQYLRPLSQTLLIPSLPHLSPPTFTRLLRVILVFRCPDAPIIEAAIEQLVTLGSAKALHTDVLVMLRILSLTEVPMVANFDKFVALCAEMFADQGRLRATEMVAVAADLLKIQKKEDVPLESVEALCGLMDKFAERMTFLIHLGVLSLSHAEALEDLCNLMHHPDTNGRIAELRAVRRRINAQEDEEAVGITSGDDGPMSHTGDDKYYMALDIDVRDTFHKISVVSFWNTFGGFRPVPGVLQVDFRQALTEVNCEVILEAVHLFDQAYPGRLSLPCKRILNRSLLAKFTDDGEEIVVPETNTIELRKAKEVLFTRDSLQKFCNMLLVTSLDRVRKDPRVWTFVHDKAVRLRLDKVVSVADAQLRSIVLSAAVAGGVSVGDSSATSAVIS